MRSDGNSPPPDQAPSCPNCGEPMRLAHAKQAYFYTNLDELEYTCECGGAATDFSPRER